MSCKSMIYTVMDAPTAIVAGGTIPVGMTIRRFGQSIRQEGNAIALLGAGYYKVAVNVTLQPTGTDSITVTLRENGNAVVGGVASATPIAAAADTLLTIPAAVVRVKCDGYKLLSIALDDAATVTNATITVEKA